MKLLKFGGTSLANAKKFLFVADIIEKNFQYGKTAVVLSAPATVTNHLVSICEEIVNYDNMLKIIATLEKIFIDLINDLNKIQSNFLYEITKQNIIRELDQIKNLTHGMSLLKTCPKNVRAIIISKGEILSVSIMKNILISKNYKVTIIDPIYNFASSGTYLDSTVDILESKKRIEKINFQKDNILLMSGFIAGNRKKELVLLGRNGSDYSAAILAVCLKAKCCEIWTDVDGVFTCDPRKIPNTHLLKSISYQEAMELSYFGAKILHPRTIEPISQFNIPCIIKNTKNIKSNGTWIKKKYNSNTFLLKGVTCLKKIAMLNISGMYIKNVRNLISRIFSIIYKNHTKIILLTQSSSEEKIAVCILEKESERFLYSLQQEFQLELHNKLLNSFRVTNNLSVLSVIGENINKKYNIASKIFSTLGTAKINVLAIAQGSSKHSISIVVEEKYISQAVKKVHYTLFNEKKIIDVLLIGIGGIGTTLLKQILQQQKSLQQKNVEIQIRVIANSKKMLMPEKKIDLSNWENDFKKTTKIFNLEVLKKIVKNHSFLNPVIVDCTSDQLISEQYIDFLNNEFHIVTSNKKANTNKLDYYKKIRKTAFKKNKKFLYETNVGAGLPAIETLKNLRNTGDHLIRFKGILSGSLSFIFGRLEEGISLSQATKEAKKLGFTEPNPCDDLSGIDVARKLLILAREAGYKTELQDIKIEPLLPKYFTNYKEPCEFLEKLKELDPIFLKKINKANSKNSVLRFVGTIKNTGQCSVKIEEISKNHPLYKVKNGENALAFYTNYYQPIPLILRGYGAGNNVTASGVFSDLLRILS